MPGQVLTVRSTSSRWVCCRSSQPTINGPDSPQTGFCHVAFSVRKKPTSQRVRRCLTQFVPASVSIFCSRMSFVRARTLLVLVLVVLVSCAPLAAGFALYWAAAPLRKGRWIRATEGWTLATGPCSIAAGLGCFHRVWRQKCIGVSGRVSPFAELQTRGLVSPTPRAWVQHWNWGPGDEACQAFFFRCIHPEA